MTSEATRKAEREKARQEEVARTAAITLKEAQAQAETRSEDDLVVASHTPPLVREDEHAFVPQEPFDGDPEEIAPDLTKTGVAGLEIAEEDALGYMTEDTNGQPVFVYVNEQTLERMSDEEIAEKGLLTATGKTIHPARVSPSSERVRSPLQRAPAAGPGTWPVPEDQMPAVMPEDPPVEPGEDPGDASLTGYPPFKAEGRKVVVYSSEGARSEVEPDETRNAAALYLRLRNQFPHFTEDQLSDEFIIQWESRVGAKQSMRPGQEISQHGLTAVGDERLYEDGINLGEARKEASQAQPNSLAPDFTQAPEAGFPSANEPATRHQDDEKFGLKSDPYQDLADLEALALDKKYAEGPEEPPLPGKPVEPPLGETRAAPKPIAESMPPSAKPAPARAAPKPAEKK